MIPLVRYTSYNTIYPQNTWSLDWSIGTMKIQDVVQRAQAMNLRLVRFLYCDNGGIIRGKATHASKLATRMREGIGQSLAMQAFTGVETLVSVDRMRSDCEIRLFPDTETIFVLPFVPPTFTILSATTPLY